MDDLETLAEETGIPLEELEDRYAELYAELLPLYPASVAAQRAEQVALWMLESECAGIAKAEEGGLELDLADGLDALSVGVLVALLAAGATSAELSAKRTELLDARETRLEKTESLWAANAEAKEKAAKEGKRLAMWVTEHDDRVEKLCLEQEARGWVPKEEMTEEPPLHPNCRCHIEYR